MNDELLDYNPEKDMDMDREIKKASPAGGGSKLSTILLIVLGVHLLVIIGVGGFHLLRGNKEIPKTPEVAATEETGITTEDSITQPVVETDHSMAFEADAQVKSSVPAASDPVWTMEKTSEPVAVTENPTAITPAVKEIPVKKALPVTMPEVYTVKKGDTLSRIARKFHTNVRALRKENGLKSDMIKIGQKLDIPGSSEVASVQESSIPGTYTVKKGDTLSKIARKFNTTTKRLVKLNGISDPNRLKIGMELRLPGAPVQQKASMENKPKPFRTPISNTDLAMLRSEESL